MIFMLLIYLFILNNILYEVMLYAQNTLNNKIEKIKKMYRKNSQRINSKLNQSIARAKKIYTSNKSLRQSQDKDRYNRIPMRKNVSSHIPKNRRIYNENCNEVRNKAVSEYQRNNNIERVFGKEVVVVNGNFNSNVLSKINTPVGEKYGNFMFQNIDCQSTAEDLAQKVNKKIGKIGTNMNTNRQQKCRIKSFLLARGFKNNKIKEECLQNIANHNEIPLQIQQNKQNRIHNQAHNQAHNSTYNQRRVFQCKIIKSAKIPFPILNKSMEKRKKSQFQCLIAQTDHISQIKIEGNLELDGVSAQSKYLIDF